MAPQRGSRKRHYSQDDGISRPSPHRPQNLALANAHYHHQQQQSSPRGGGGRRQSRNSGRGGSSVPQSPNITHPSPAAMSPPATTSQSSRPLQAASSNPAASIEQPAPALRAKAVSASNEYLTLTRVAQWSAESREVIVQAAIAALAAGNVLTLSVIFHEIIEAAIDLSMDSAILGSMIRDIIAAPADELVDPESTFLDTLSSLTQDKDKQVLVRQMLVATGIHTSRMRAELETDLLVSLGLVRDSFNKMGVRKATHALYRQSNYNLLREETEGYSKLMTEYFTTVNSQLPTQEVIDETYQRVNALIGAFDLDIGRVLDVTLDVFANLLVKHGRFFVKFLRSSAWWPESRTIDGVEWEAADVPALPRWAQSDCPQCQYSEEEKDKQQLLREQRDRKFWQRVGELGDRSGIEAFFELGGSRIIADNRQSNQRPAEGTSLSKQQASQKWADEWMEQTKTLPPSGNEIAAQLLGFKLRFYASDTRDSSDFLPDNLIYLAALLIKIGFISILDLYPHLYPLEEDMPAHKEKLLKAKKEREQKEKGGVANALTMAGALPDEVLPPSVARLRENDSKSRAESERGTSVKAEEVADRKKVLPEPADQKFQLLKSLICIGALPEAFFILGRHPWMLDVYPELFKLIFRLAHHSLSKVYEAARATESEQISVSAKGAGPRSGSKPTDYIPRRILRWAKPDERDAGDGIDYKFYWEDWTDNVPVCQDVDDVVKLCNTLLGLVGPECGQDILLLTKIVRISKKSLADDTSTANRKRWISFSATFIAPALSFTGKNPGVINEVWDLFKQFDTATRYTIYQQWFTGNKPAIRAAFADVQSKTKHELSRITATNTKEYGRKIAKVSYSSPGIVFQMTVKQLVAYPNMINALVECSRYLTLLGYDCLTWTLVRFFMSPDKGSTQDDGMLSAPWLKNIASFVGKAYQKYNLMDPIPILQFATQQLLQSEGELYMLDVLEQMIKSMGGVGLSGSLSESTVLALCGGPVLRNFTLTYHLSDNRQHIGSSAKRLVRCLKDTGLAPQILMALAQHMEAYVHREDQQETPDKVVLFNVDKLRSNLIQYLELLRSYISAAEFDEVFPPLIEMIRDFGIEPDVAFTVARASISAKATVVRCRQHAVLLEVKADTNDDTPMLDSEDAIANQGLKGTPAVDIEMTEAASLPDNDKADATISSSKLVPMKSLPDLTNSAIEDLASRLREALPETFANHPCLSFYVTFWQLSLQDVEDEGIKQQYRSAIFHFERQLPNAIPERRGYKANANPKKEEESRRAKAEISRFQHEQEVFTRTNIATQDTLRAEMQHWFDGVPMRDSRSDALHNALLQDCFIPRSRMSLEDAQFAASMLKFMHKSGVPGFRTIKLLDLLFNSNKLTCIISMYTEEESRTFGRFLSEILRELQIWHDNKDDAYTKRAHGLVKKVPGFGRSFNVDREATDFLKYEDFCLLLYKWHKALFTATKACIDSGNYMQIRNSINVLNAVCHSFPKVDTMATELRQTIVQLGKDDERDDLKTALQSILGGFKKNERFWTKDHEFRHLPAPPAPPAAINGAEKTKKETEEPQDPKLHAAAPALKPSSESDGVQISSSEGQAEDLQRSGAAEPLASKLPSRDRGNSRATMEHDKMASSSSTSQAGGSVKVIAKQPLPPQSAIAPTRPDTRGPLQSTSASRASHALPSRPDAQPGRPRQPDRDHNDRPAEHIPQSRYENRGPLNDYGRLERPGETSRPREPSPGHHLRPPLGGRTPERVPQMAEHRDWNSRDPSRDPREYDDRSIRGPPRDARAHIGRTQQNWDPRDAREPRDQRERSDSRNHPQQQNSTEPRRMPSSASLTHDHAFHRRDAPPSDTRSGDRDSHVLSRAVPIPPSPASEGPMVNPARAALINQAELTRPEPQRHDRDDHRDRSSHPQSPRRYEDRRSDDRRGDGRTEERPSSGYHGRNDVPREYRDERSSQQVPMPSNRDRREDAASNTPIGPRGGRSETSSSSRPSREMLQPHQGSRSSYHQSQDPNYGRLNQPSDSVPPMGPRRDRPHNQSQSPATSVPTASAAAHPPGIHPSRIENIQTPNRVSNGPPLLINVPLAPSGPRVQAWSPQGPPIPPSPTNWGPPTGPAANDRGQRNTGNPLRTINNVLAQNPPNDRPNERNPLQANPPVRGRGANRANGPIDENGSMQGFILPPHNSALNSRGDAQYIRSNRNDGGQGRPDGPAHEEGRSEPRNHRESRRSERGGQDRTSDRSSRRADERSNHGMPSERAPHVEQESRTERDRTREKRGGGERESSRRERDGGSSGGGGERSNRDSERSGSGREPREGSRRERTTRDDSRTSGHEERGDRRSKNQQQGSPDDGRKRNREQMDQGPPYGEGKRRR